MQKPLTTGCIFTIGGTREFVHHIMIIIIYNIVKISDVFKTYVGKRHIFAFADLVFAMKSALFGKTVSKSNKL